MIFHSVLKSKRAVQVNIEIMRAFVKLREMIAADSLFHPLRPGPIKLFASPGVSAFESISPEKTLDRRSQYCEHT